MASRAELDRRVTGLENRLAWLDEHGTRGVDGIRLQIKDIAEDIGKVDARTEELGKKVDARFANGWQRFLAYGLALLPIYVLLFLAVFSAHTGG